MNGVDRFAEVMFIIITSITALVLLGVATRYLWKRTSRAETPAPRLNDDRLQRIEDAVDTIAVEIERMSEAQRFTAKLLLERGVDPAQLQQAQAKLPQPVINARG